MILVKVGANFLINKVDIWRLHCWKFKWLTLDFSRLLFSIKLGISVNCLLPNWIEGGVSRVITLEINMMIITKVDNEWPKRLQSRLC
jgi:hypothetical protein